MPANKFLTGCVFIIVEDKYWFEDYCIDSASTRLVIMQHGGIVEKTYSSKITHCVSLNRNNIIVQRVKSFFSFFFYIFYVTLIIDFVFLLGYRRREKMCHRILAYRRSRQKTNIEAVVGAPHTRFVQV